MSTELIDRRKFIGGSDIAAILGMSPWRTAVALWDEKRRPPSDEPQRERGVLKRGKRWESVVAEMLVERLEADGHSVEIVASNKRYTHPATALDFAACEIDFELLLDDSKMPTNCELKTVHPFKSREWGESDSDELPVHYTAQAMWGLGITGRERCVVAALFGADELRTYTVERDDDTIRWMFGEAAKFWDLVQSGTPPQPVAITDLDILHPADSEAPALIADAELTQAILRMRAISMEIKARSAEYESLEFMVKRAMGDCTSLVVGTESREAASWKERRYSWLDQKGIAEAHPKIAKEFTRKGTSRVFAIKPFSTEGVIP